MYCRPDWNSAKKIIEEHARIEALYRMMSGNVSGARMDLETYVQRYYLERILYAANRRFQEMSAGQFELRMCDIDKAGTGKNRGLDLMVYSAVTGKVREVRTLSGGGPLWRHFPWHLAWQIRSRKVPQRSTLI